MRSRHVSADTRTRICPAGKKRSSPHPYSDLLLEWADRPPCRLRRPLRGRDLKTPTQLCKFCPRRLLRQRRAKLPIFVFCGCFVTTGPTVPALSAHMLDKTRSFFPLHSQSATEYIIGCPLMLCFRSDSKLPPSQTLSRKFCSPKFCPPYLCPCKFCPPQIFPSQVLTSASFAPSSFATRKFCSLEVLLPANVPPQGLPYASFALRKLWEESHTSAHPRKKAGLRSACR